MTTSMKKSLTLPSGDEIPLVGIGTYTVWMNKSDIYPAITSAIEAGYRHVDCAAIYFNEDEVGRALSDQLKKGTIKRDEVFITSKLNLSYHARDRVRKSVEKSLGDLQLDYLDLLLIHWPTDTADDNDPMKETYEYGSIDYVDTWKGMEDCQDAGLIRNLGLSNFNSVQIQRILDNSRIKPATLQIEVNPYFTQDRLISFCKDRGIIITCYAPLGAPGRPWLKAGETNILEEPVVKEIATAKGKTAAQVVLRFAMQRGLLVIPKSLNPERIKENIQVFDFELSDEDMTQIKQLNRDLRVYGHPQMMQHRNYPFNEPF